jgi:hypothetical protein
MHKYKRITLLVFIFIGLSMIAGNRNQLFSDDFSYSGVPSNEETLIAKGKHGGSGHHGGHGHHGRHGHHGHHGHNGRGWNNGYHGWNNGYGRNNWNYGYWNGNNLYGKSWNGNPGYYYDPNYYYYSTQPVQSVQYQVPDTHYYFDNNYREAPDYNYYEQENSNNRSYQVFPQN